MLLERTAAQARSDIRTYKGIGVSPGIAIGRAVIVEKRIASIFEAHALMVSDPSFADKVIQKIESEQVNAEWALSEVQEEFQARFESFDDNYLRERTADVRDVAERVLKHLQGVAHHDLSEITHDVV